MIEDDAKTKWCPFTRVQIWEPIMEGDNPPVNREDSNTRCIGSQCMAWRWFSEDYKGTGGYCGLAGAP